MYHYIQNHVLQHVVIDFILLLLSSQCKQHLPGVKLHLLDTIEFYWNIFHYEMPDLLLINTCK